MSENNAIHKFKAGDKFHDRYLLEKLVGVGGFADVWKAVDETTHTTVALKIYTNLDEDGFNDLSEEYTRMQSLNRLEPADAHQNRQVPDLRPATDQSQTIRARAEARAQGSRAHL